MAIARKPAPKTLEATEAKTETAAAVASFAPVDFAAVSETAQKYGESFRSSVEQALAQGRTAYEKAKESAEHNSTAVETSFETVKAGAAALNGKALDVFKTLFESQIAFTKAALGAKTVADVAALGNEFARKQVEFFTAQTKEFGAHAQKVAAEAIEPIKARVESAFASAA